MDANEQRLLVSIEARMTKYERDMARARNATNDNFKKMEGRARQSADNMEKSMSKASASIASKLEGMFAPLMAGGAVVAGVGGAAVAFREIANSVAEVDREARKAGVTSKVWQQWTQVATATGMSIDGMTDALKELNIRGDEFAKTGKGSAEEAFQRLGYSAVDVAQKLKTLAGLWTKSSPSFSRWTRQRKPVSLTRCSVELARKSWRRFLACR
jgi:hypothetical protein